MKPILLMFDLNTRVVKRLFNNVKKPYSLIEAFVARFGFHREQGSGFVNRVGMTASQQSAFLQALVDELPWLRKAARNIIFAEIANDIDPFSTDPRQFHLPFGV